MPTEVGPALYVQQAGGNTAEAASANAAERKKMPSGAYPVVDPAAGIELSETDYQLALLYLRTTPTALSDPRMFRSYIELVTCGDHKTATQMQNEFDGAQISAFYRDNVSAILANVPSRIRVGVQIALDQYDFASSSFPIVVHGLPQMLTGLHPDARGGGHATQGLSIDYADFAGRTVKITHCPTAIPLDFTLRPTNKLNQSTLVYEVAFSPIALDRVKMDQTAAREYIEQHPGRAAYVVLNLEISGDGTKFFQGPNYPVVVFSSRVTGMSIYDSYPMGKEIAKIDLSTATGKAAETGTAGSISGAAGVQPSPVVSAGQANPVSAGSSALPVPVVHDGVAGKVLSKFLEKCSAGDSKGCEMAGYDLENGYGADKDPQAAKAYYAKACSMGRKGDCGK
ncbi:hypothetical protein [Terracidiphilus gabretensis]|uniref:hypothetical protein n=1 Tax=Terracidiphilus gabretensis TaxID=1577687 RepID=UPI0012F8D863|nr:hypothetical protein [Terracidiphilus gabretensis]